MHGAQLRLQHGVTLGQIGRRAPAAAAGCLPCEAASRTHCDLRVLRLVLMHSTLARQRANCRIIGQLSSRRDRAAHCQLQSAPSQHCTGPLFLILKIRIYR